MICVTNLHLKAVVTTLHCRESWWLFKSTYFERFCPV